MNQIKRLDFESLFFFNFKLDQKLAKILENIDKMW